MVHSTWCSTKRKCSRQHPIIPGDEIVISGISARLPKCKNLNDFAFNLYNKIDMINDDEVRWPHFNSGIPDRHGYVRNLEKFDAKFFSLSYKEAHTLDAQCRLLLETAYESIFDAGVNPSSLVHTKTGVFICSYLSEAEKIWLYEKPLTRGLGLTGTVPCMFANQISYSLGLNGPSMFIDSACSSSLSCLDAAFDALRTGECDAALVGGVNISLNQVLTYHFVSVGVLSPDGYCKPFDINGNGYTRSEGCCIMFLQKIRDAKRNYASLKYAKINCDGFKMKGILFPSEIIQKKLLTEFYHDIELPASEVKYVETHGTGTVAGDPVECYALDHVLCATTRLKPLRIGSVKSNIGHTEAVSGSCAILKSILIFHFGVIPPNLHLKQIAPTIPSLVDGRIVVNTESTKFDESLIALNSFGFGGSNGHALLGKNLKTKQQQPTDSKLPVLVFWAGRTDESIRNFFHEIETKQWNSEFIALIHQIHKDEICGHDYRAIGLYKSVAEDVNTKCIYKTYEYCLNKKEPVIWFYTGQGTEWLGMGNQLLQIPIFKESILYCHEILERYDINLLNILQTNNLNTFDTIENVLIGITAVQIGITDILQTIEMNVDHFIGCSIGEIACAYANGYLTMDETILLSYAIGLYLKITDISDLITDQHLGVICPKTLTNLRKLELIFIHSQICIEILNKFLLFLNRKPMKWLIRKTCATVNNDDKNEIWNRFIDNVLESKKFIEFFRLLPKNSLIIEIAPKGILENFIKKYTRSVHYVQLTRISDENTCEYFLRSLGRLFLCGHNFAIDRLYPTVEFPVSRGTPLLSPLIKWDHKDDWYTFQYAFYDGILTSQRKIKIDLSDREYSYMSGHVVDEKCLVPATAYIQMVWETLAISKKIHYFQINVKFNDIRFLRATELKEDQITELLITLHYGMGSFEIQNGNNIIVTGKIKHIINPIKLFNIPSYNFDQSSSDDQLIYKPDFYKELRLRGYQYSGIFQSVKFTTFNGSHGEIEWQANWIAFMDCLLQISIISKDSRSLLLPTKVKQLKINGPQHMEYVKQLKSDIKSLNAVYDKNLDILTAGAVEINGIYGTTVSKRSVNNSNCLLESYQFHPYVSQNKHNISKAMLIVAQIMMENLPDLVNGLCVEIDQYNNEPIIEDLSEVFLQMPLVNMESFYLTRHSSDIQLGNGIHVEDKTIDKMKNCTIIIGNKCLTHTAFIQKALRSMADNSYLLCREDDKPNLKHIPDNLMLVSVIPIDENQQTLVLLQRKTKPESGKEIIIKIDQDDQKFDWLYKLKYTSVNDHVILVTENDPHSGIIGLVNCIRKEPHRQLIFCFFIDDPNAPPFDSNDPFYRKQIDLGLAINIFRNGEWGSYRHLPLIHDNQIVSHDEHYYANVLVKGNLSSFSWFMGPINARQSNQNIVNVQYAALNFRDVLLATGKLSVEVANTTRLQQECVLGFEYAGINQNGDRIMGIVPSGGLATQLIPFEHLNWIVPDNWSLKDAVTCPIVYATVYSCLFFHNNSLNGKSILIHAGSGAVGLAAMRIAFTYGMEVYTTVSTSIKRKFILKTFSTLKDANIGNSRDCSFEKMIKIRTNGIGVDYVINSLSGELLHATIRCVKRGGTFLEIGRVDMANDTEINLSTLRNNIKFRSIMLDNIYVSSVEEKQKLHKLVEDGIESGIIKPLYSTVFELNELEKASRLLSSGRHIGKVVIKLRENETDRQSLPVKIISKIYFNPDRVYIIVGGLGGFALELIDWMIIRGARNFVLNSRNGIKNSYQKYRINIWESYNCKIAIDTNDVTTITGCKKLLTESLEIAEIDGIFNLALVLRDGILKNQTSTTFMECMASKSIATKYLDQLSRRMTPKLNYFVIFSSASCGRGNAGQSNYGMANSIMERIIEQRIKLKLPGKAIQWGPIGDVGVLIDTKLYKSFGGFELQSITSCLSVLDDLLTANDPIVSSLIISEKRLRSSASGSDDTEDLVTGVLNIIGIRNAKNISPLTTLAELGMESLTVIEIQNLMERKLKINMTADELRTMTVHKLQQLEEQHVNEIKTQIEPNISNANVHFPFEETAKVMTTNWTYDESSTSQLLIRITTANNSETYESCMVFVPGMDGIISTTVQNMFSHMNLPVFCVQLHDPELNSISTIVKALHQPIKEIFKNKKFFYLVSYSYGSIIAMKLAKLLEDDGFDGHLLVIDGGPMFVKQAFLSALETKIKQYDTFEAKDLIAHLLIDIFFEKEVHENFIQELSEFETTDERLSVLSERISIGTKFPNLFVQKTIDGIIHRVDDLITFDIDKVRRIRSSITLIRTTEKLDIEVAYDHELTNFTDGDVNVIAVEGNHLSILKCCSLGSLIVEHDPYKLHGI